MEKIWVIYDKTRYEKNKWFYQKIKQEFLLFNTKCKLVFSENFDYSTKYFPEISIMRTYDLKLHAFLEKNNVKVLNSYQISSIANDKLSAYDYLIDKDIPILPYSKETINSIENTLNSRTYPMVCKGRFGHGGNQIFLVKSDKELKDAFLKIGSQSVILQKQASILGKDVRVYVIGNQIVKSMLRVSEDDFRSNYSLGSSAKEYSLSQDELKIVNKILSLLYFDFAGIDFVFDSKMRFVLNEIEDIVGSRMIYDNTNMDILKEYVKYIYTHILTKT